MLKLEQKFIYMHILDTEKNSEQRVEKFVLETMKKKLNSMPRKKDNKYFVKKKQKQTQ